MDELDLTKPGKLWAIVENEKTTTFHLVLQKPSYTQADLSLNPNVDPKDELMSPFSVPAGQAGKDGMVTLDLDASGRAKEVLSKLEQLYASGHPPIAEVRAIVIASAKDGNRVPMHQVASVRDFRLADIPMVKLFGTREDTYITVLNYKAGKKEFTVELTPSGPLREVALTTEPASPMKTSAGPQGQGKLVIPVRSGQKVTITIPAPLSMKKAVKKEQRERLYYHYGRRAEWNELETHWNRAYAKSRDPYGGGHFAEATVEREEWTGGSIVLRAAGTGGLDMVSDSVKLEAQTWAADWLVTVPPPPFQHNCC